MIWRQNKTCLLFGTVSYLSHGGWLFLDTLREQTSRSVQFDAPPVWIRCIYTWSTTKTAALLLFKILTWQYFIEAYRISSCLFIHSWGHNLCTEFSFENGSGVYCIATFSLTFTLIHYRCLLFCVPFSKCSNEVYVCLHTHTYSCHAAREGKSSKSLSFCWDSVVHFMIYII